MRTDGQEADDAGRVDLDRLEEFFLPAIVSLDPLGGLGEAMRDPHWFIASYAFSQEQVLKRVLDHIGLRFHLFQYEFKKPRQKPTTRSWFPGYIFLNFDRDYDRWQQLHRIPGITAILGRAGLPAPLDDEVMEDLLRRLSRWLPKNTAETSIAAGTRVKILRGAFRDHIAVVERSDKKQVRIIMMLFDRPSFVTVRLQDVKIAEG